MTFLEKWGELLELLEKKDQRLGILILFAPTMPAAAMALVLDVSGDELEESRKKVRAALVAWNAANGLVKE